MTIPSNGQNYTAGRWHLFENTEFDNLRIYITKKILLRYGFPSLYRNEGGSCSRKNFLHFRTRNCIVDLSRWTAIHVVKDFESLILTRNNVYKICPNRIRSFPGYWPGSYCPYGFLNRENNMKTIYRLGTTNKKKGRYVRYLTVGNPQRAINPGEYFKRII